MIAKTTTTIPTTNFVQTFKYDSINRLTEAKENTGSGTAPNWIQTFGYDRFGNRTQFEQTVSGLDLPSNNITKPTIDQTNNRFTTGQGYVYDFNGNLIQDAEGRSFTFNGDDKQTEVINAANQVVGRYSYDGSGARVKKSHKYRNDDFCLRRRWRACGGVFDTGPQRVAPAQGQAVAAGTQNTASSTAAQAAASNATSGTTEGGVTQLPTAAGDNPVISLCTPEYPCNSPTGGVSYQRIDTTNNEPLKSVEGIARVFELCSLAPGIGSACAIGAAATRFGQGRFDEAGENALNVVPFLGWAKKADKAADVAQGAHEVYVGVNAAGVVKYVGITSRGVATRAAEHLRAVGTGKELLRYRVVKGYEGLTKLDARIIEQKLINNHGLENLLNKRNEIAKKFWKMHGIELSNENAYIN